MTDADLRTIDDALIRMRRMWTSPSRIRDADLGDVDMSTMWIVHFLSEHGGHATISTLAQDLDVAHSTASRLVARAEAVGAVDRTADPDDSRTVQVGLTARGRRLADEGLRFRLRLLSRATADFTPAEREKFADLLRRFAHADKPKGTP
jgi:DNA-binding MarR family transcriptional regulator